MRARFLPGLLLPVLMGCSSDPYKVAPVSGVVHLNGKPLANTSVTFAPVAAAGNLEPGPSSAATTDSAGRYTLELIGKNGQGAVVGKHKVRISIREDADISNDNPVKVQQLPMKYNAQTTLEFDVPAGGTDKADFDLKVP
ncbi:MAG TPA: hypothetical protein VM533_18815 [Fimbriiglobus sp.]|nr:hypothetical protein [Fimbriiglobus sp.]